MDATATIAKDIKRYTAGMRHSLSDAEKEAQSLLSKVENTFRRTNRRETGTRPPNDGDREECEELARRVAASSSRWRLTSSLTAEVLAELLRMRCEADAEIYQLQRTSTILDFELDTIWSSNAELQAQIARIEKLLEREHHFFKQSPAADSSFNR